MVERSARNIAWVFAVAFGALCATDSSVSAVVLPYDIVYVRQPRFGDTTNTTWPEVSHPAAIDPGADLMLLHPDGSEELLVAGGVGSVTDPFVSFDGNWVYYSLFYDMRSQAINSQRDLPRLGADIFRIHLQTRQIEQLTFGEFTPNTGAGNFDETNALNPPSGHDYLGYGILNLGASPIAGGRIAFTSNRNGFMPPRGLTRPTMQLYVMDEDGRNVEQIAPMNIGSALHPTPMRDGRIMFSTMETQGLRDSRVWGIWAIYPDGRRWEPIVSAFRSAQAFHFMTQLSNQDIVVVDYYNLNNNGFGALYRLPVAPPPGQPPFHGAFPSDNPSIEQTVGGGFLYPFRMAFTPRGMYSISPFTHGNDEAAPIGTDGIRVGKFTHPSAAPGGDLLAVWSPGPTNDLNRPTTDPRYDAGLYLIPNGDIVNSPDELILIKNDPSYNEAWPRAVVPYSAVHGVTEPAQLPWLPNDGTVHGELPAGTPYGLIGTSSFYKRESFPGFVRSWANTFDGLDVFNTTENDQSSNWSYQGSDAGLYDDSDIWAVRVVAMEPSTHRSYGPNGGPSGGQLFSSHASERLRILGEIPLRKYDGNGYAILDPEGNPDTSFLARIPADTPFTFQTIDRDGRLLNAAQTWHQVRPGEMRADCGGCHAHSQQPLDFGGTAAAAPGYQVVDLVHETPLVTKDANGDPDLRIEPSGVHNVEFYRDIRPLLVRSCVPCHTQSDPDPPGALVLDDYNIYGRLPGDYARLAADSGASWGYLPLVRVGNDPVWRQTNASRYIRRFQSRRSLLVWKIFGERTDGWSNADHPTESVPGNATTLPPGASINEADLDFTGSMMPPPGSGVPPLSDDEKLTIVRWIDLGAPINWGSDGNTPWGWFLDDLKPTLAMSSPRRINIEAVTEIRIGVADAHTGIDPSSLSISADFIVNGRPTGSELADLAAADGDGIYRIVLDAPIGDSVSGLVDAAIADNQGNITRVFRSFTVQTSGAPPTPTDVAPPTDTPTSTPTWTPTPTDIAPPSDTPTSTATETPADPPATATDTLAPAPTDTPVPPTETPHLAGLSGRITSIAGSQPLAAVEVALIGTENQATTSDEIGIYDFATVDPGTWTVRPSKRGDTTAVTALDAAWALQATVGMRELDRIQAVACDVTGNGSVSALDASHILRYRVQKLAYFDVSAACESDWFFIPTADPATGQSNNPPAISNGSCEPGNISYSTLREALQGQDFVAAPFGDCSASAPTPARIAATGSDQAIVVIGDLRKERRRIIRLPVWVRSPGASSALELRLEYDPARLRLLRIRKARGAGSAMMAHLSDESGSAFVAMASAGELVADDRPLLLMVFERVRSRGDNGRVRVASATVDDLPVRVVYKK
jgi:hypothetical protein